MQTWIHLIAAFSLLLSWEDSKNESPIRLWSRKLGYYLQEGLLLAAVVLSNVLIARGFKSVFDQADFQLPLIWLVSYLCASLGKKTNIYFLTFFSFSYYSTKYESGLSLAQGAARVLSAGILTGLFHSLLTGVKKRILFSPIPKISSGILFLIFITAVLSLCLSGVAQAISLMF